jgi:very-short-patch-repair endonuclease
MEPVGALHRLGGVAAATTLRQLCDPWQIRVAVRDGAIVRVGPRRYALPAANEAHQAAARLNGVVSHLSAALFWGWKVKLAPELPVVTVPRGRKRSSTSREGIDVRWASLPADAIHAGMVTTRIQTVVDCARTLPFDAGLSVADSALREGRLTRAQLLAAASASPRTGRERALRVVRAADPRAANPFESCLRAVAVTVPGLVVEPQVQVDDIGRADLVSRALRVVIEADSHEFHSDEQAFRNDIRRYTAMVRNGWIVVRFCWEDVMFKQEYVAQVLADLVRTPWLRTVQSSAG